MKYYFCIYTIATCLCINNVQAQGIATKEKDENLDTIKVIHYTSSQYKINTLSPSLRLNAPIIEVPQNIQIITGKVLEDQQIFDMSEGVSRNVSGVAKMAHHDNYVRLYMRGTRLSPFRNGMSLTSTWGPPSEDMSIVDHIEFVKGPSGFMLANGDPGGFYNIVTKKPTGGGENKNKVSLSGGSFNNYRVAVDLDGKLTKDGKLLYRFNIMGNYRETFRAFDYNHRFTIAPVLTYKFNDKTSIDMEYNFNYLQMSLLSGQSYVFNTTGYASLPRNFTNMEKGIPTSKIYDHNAQLTLHHQFSSDWKLTSQLGFFNFKNRGHSIWPKYPLKENGDITRNLGSWDDNGKTFVGQLFVNGHFHTGFLSHKILTGIDIREFNYMAEFGQGRQLGAFNIYHPQYGVTPKDSFIFDYSKSLDMRATWRNKQSNMGLYFQDELGFFNDKLRLTLAGRVTFLTEYNRSSKAWTHNVKLTPRVGLSFSIDKYTAVYGVYDVAFLPQTGVIFPETPATPLNATNIEFGIKRDWFGGKWNTTASAYHIWRNDIVGTDIVNSIQGGAQYVIPIGQTITKGVEVDVKGEIIPGLDVIINYAYTDAKVTKTAGSNIKGNVVPGFNKHMTNAWLSYRLQKSILKGLGYAVGYQYQNHRQPWSFQQPTEKFNQKLPDYFRLDMSLSWQNEKIGVIVNVNNVLNTYLYLGTPYSSLEAYYWQAEEPINFRATVSYKF